MYNIRLKGESERIDLFETDEKEFRDVLDFLIDKVLSIHALNIVVYLGSDIIGLKLKLNLHSYSLYSYSLEFK